MFNSTIQAEQVKYLKTVIDTVANIVSGPRTFKLTQEGLSFESMDQGSVFLYFNVQKSFFQIFELQNDILELRINIDDLKKVLSRTISSDEILTLNFSDSNKFGINFSKSTGQGQKRKYELALHNPDDDEEKRNIADVIKTIPLTAHIDFASGVFKDILSDVGIAGEKDAKHLIVQLNHLIAKFEINRGSEGMNAEVEVPFTEENMFLEEGETEVKSSYDMDYLDKLTKLDLLASKVRFEFGTDKPLRITFTISGFIDFIFVMAPLVEEDEESEEEDNE